MWIRGNFVFGKNFLYISESKNKTENLLLEDLNTISKI